VQTSFANAPTGSGTSSMRYEIPRVSSLQEQVNIYVSDAAETLAVELYRPYVAQSVPMSTRLFHKPYLMAAANSNVLKFGWREYIAIGIAGFSAIAIVLSMISALLIPKDPLDWMMPVGAVALLLASFLAASPKVKSLGRIPQ
jgi:hypothetical protein